MKYCYCTLHLKSEMGFIRNKKQAAVLALAGGILLAFGIQKGVEFVPFLNAQWGAIFLIIIGFLLLIYNKKIADRI